MIIGISGKAQSGKDTVGKIIQYLTSDTEIGWYNYNICTNEHLSNWQIVKFADALKDIVCILTGCTREQLENIDFKNSNLGNIWGTVSVFIPYIDKYTITCNTKYRELLQILGTDLLRNQLHNDVWVNALMSKYKPINIKGNIKPRAGGIRYFGDAPNWIITDVRFPNELKAVKDRGGISIRITKNKPKIGLQLVTEHYSETALDDIDFDYNINNNASIEDLILKVKEILIKEKII